jgi:hypothetical protein
MRGRSEAPSAFDTLHGPAIANRTLLGEDTELRHMRPNVVLCGGPQTRRARRGRWRPVRSSYRLDAQPP